MAVLILNNFVGSQPSALRKSELHHAFLETNPNLLNIYL